MIHPFARERWPVLGLFHPHERARLLLVTLLLAALAWGLAVWRAGLPVWGATTIAAALLAGPLALKWQDDWKRVGATTTLLGVLLLLQGLHTIEHVVQVIQWYALAWSPARSGGLISSLNAEWVHFVWNWLVVAAILTVMRGGMRNGWAWLLLLWALAHSGEHSYLFARYLQIRQAMLDFGVPEPQVAQALPGILGRDGLLSQTLNCRIPGLTTTSRIAVHFWWNAGEIALLALAANRHLRLSAARTEALPPLASRPQ